MEQTALRGGIDLGGTKIQTVVVGPDNQVLGQARMPTPSDGPAAVAAAMATALQAAATAAGTTAAALGGIGVGAPGVIDAVAGTVAHAGNIPGWDIVFPLVETLSTALGAPVGLGNDVDVATLAEFELGAGAPYHDLLGVFWGTGVGGGLILAGTRWVGRGSPGELGHMVVRRGGALCPCGRRGCVEAYAGRGAMEAYARRLHEEENEPTRLFKIMERRGKPRLSSGVWAEALEHGDDMAERLIERALLALGAGVASAINLLDVPAVIIGGGLGTRLGQPYADRILAAMMPHLFVDSRPPVVLTATLGDLGGAIGATLIAPAPAPA
ncbi:MAG: glucokinase [Pseudonocardiales bacterium]|jgi:glucokinase|nr:glucokinase [Pseudonocardiales bacterium]